MKHPPVLLSDLEVPGGKAGLRRLAQSRLRAEDRLEVVRLAEQMDRAGDLTKDVLDIFAHTDRMLVHAVEIGVAHLSSALPRRLRSRETTSSVQMEGDHASCKRGKSCKGQS